MGTIVCLCNAYEAKKHAQKKAMRQCDDSGVAITCLSLAWTLTPALEHDQCPGCACEAQAWAD
jgi:hypothetical protein